MLNWIGLYSVNMLLTKVKDASTPYTKPLAGANKSALLPNAGLDKMFANNEFVTIGLALSVLIAILVWVILEKTKFGYELKATGLNKNAAKYCGMREKEKHNSYIGHCGRTCGIWCGNLLSDRNRTVDGSADNRSCKWALTELQQPFWRIESDPGYFFILFYSAYYKWRYVCRQDNVLYTDFGSDFGIYYLPVADLYFSLR